MSEILLCFNPAGPFTGFAKGDAGASGREEEAVRLSQRPSSCPSEPGFPSQKGFLQRISLQPTTRPRPLPLPPSLPPLPGRRGAGRRRPSGCRAAAGRQVAAAPQAAGRGGPGRRGPGLFSRCGGWGGDGWLCRYPRPPPSGARRARLGGAGGPQEPRRSRRPAALPRPTFHRGGGPGWEAAGFSSGLSAGELHGAGRGFWVGWWFFFGCLFFPYFTE